MARETACVNVEGRLTTRSTGPLARIRSPRPVNVRVSSTEDVMSLELDHVFICVEEIATTERVLADFGIHFDPRTVHGGQGTANACAFFDNAYLELLSPHDERELRSPAVRPLALWDRIHWRRTGASPFGIALRTEKVDLSIKTWPYEAAFLPPGKSIPIGRRQTPQTNRWCFSSRQRCRAVCVRRKRIAASTVG